MRVTDIALSEQALTTCLIDELGRNQRMLVIVDRNDLTWPDRFADKAALAWSPMRVRRRSSGYRTIELIGSSHVDIVTTRAIDGGAAHGRAYDIVAVPVDAGDELLEAVMPTLVATDGQLLRHEGMA